MGYLLKVSTDGKLCMALLFREICVRVSAAINVCFSSEASETPYQILLLLLMLGAFPVYAAQEGSFTF